MAATALQSVIMVFWKEIVFPLSWKSRERERESGCLSEQSTLIEFVVIKHVCMERRSYRYYYYFLRPLAQSRRLKIKQLRLDMALNQI